MPRRAYPEAAKDAVNKYVEFHRLDPLKIGEMPSSFRIPSVMYRAGRALWVTYRSAKVDPETLRRPTRPVDYIHEHDAGVQVYVRDQDEFTDERVEVPEAFRAVDAIAKLGKCLGYGFVDDDSDEHTARGTRPLPDLYTIPSGRCLLVVQSQREVLAMIWGGSLGVYARGIDG